VWTGRPTSRCTLHSRCAEPRMQPRAGVSAPEALVALLLGLFVAHLGLSALARMRTVQTGLASRADALIAQRVARLVLRTELRRGRAGTDWVADGDSVSLRAFRGTAWICPNDTAATEVLVSYGGDREPDPTKDSVVVVGAEGTEELRALVQVRSAPGACGRSGPGAPQAWRFDAPIPRGSVAARLYERGSYHVSSAALRYRRGASGRQPLTPEVWSEASGFASADGRLGLEVTPSDSQAGRPWNGFLAWLRRP
jgi:Tfp pilus assembly protein PilV